MTQKIESASTAYGNISTGLNHEDLRRDMEAKYGLDLAEYLKETKNTPESKEIRDDIIEISQASHDYKKLVTYLSIKMNNSIERETRDNRVQIAKLKNELESLISAPDYEVLGGTVNGIRINIFGGLKIDKHSRTTGEVTQEDTSIPGWTKIKYGNKEELFIFYQGQDKISFYRGLNSEFLGTGNIVTKKTTVTQGNFNRNGSFETQRYEKNVLVEFNIRRLNLKLDMKFYDYGKNDDKKH